MRRQRGAIGLAAFAILAVAAAACVAGLWAYYGTELAGMRRSLKAAEERYGKAHAELTTCSSTRAALDAVNKDFAAQVAAQNRDIDAIRKERDDRKAEHASASARAAQVDAVARTRAAELLLMRAPADELERCRAAEKLGRDYVRARRPS